MFRRFVKKLIADNKEFILKEVVEVRGLMDLLMKNRNTNEKWTKEEIQEIKAHIKNISKLVPAAIVFLLPGGIFLLPFLAEVLDRRKVERT